MTSIVDWAAGHARMVLACLLLALGAGITAYFQLPKEGAPDIDIPAYFISVVYPGISAEDSEKLLVRPMESRLHDVDGLKSMTSTAAEGYAGIALEFEFDHDKSRTLADLRDKVSQAEATFPSGAKVPVITEFSFSTFPILVVVLSGELPERTMQRVARRLQEVAESVPGVLEVGLTGHRPEMLEVLIDPLKLEAYNVTANELVRVVSANNQLIAAGEVETGSGAFALKVPSSFNDPRDVYDLPVKVNGERIVTLGDLANIRMTFEDRSGFARHNGESTIALQVVKRKGFNVIETPKVVRAVVLAEVETWPEELRDAVTVDFAQDLSLNVEAMVSQLESSVLTAICLVMIVVLAALGLRSAILVGFAVPTSFLLCFSFLAIMQIAISNIVMFGLILAVGMLVDSAIVVVELADRRISDGGRPMAAYVEAAKRMFWPIVSSTATTLCAFLPMLFWPGIPGQFMGTLPVTIMFVLSASLVVALIFLPVVGGLAARFSMILLRVAEALSLVSWPFRLIMFLVSGGILLVASLMVVAPWLLLGPAAAYAGIMPQLAGSVIFAVASIALAIVINSFTVSKASRLRMGRRRTIVGRLIKFVVGNPFMPVVVVAAVIVFVVGVFQYYSANNYGVTFFVDAEPERARISVLARGNLSLEEKNELVRSIEDYVVGTEGVASVFGFTGEGGLTDLSGAGKPVDTIGEIQIEFEIWEDRQALGGDAVDTRLIVENIERQLLNVVGINTDVRTEASGPAAGKPISLHLSGSDWDSLLETAERVRRKFDETPGLVFIDDTRPLPGIDWQVEVDIEEAGRFGADVATIGTLVQLITRGILLDTMRVDTSDEEIDVRVRFPVEDRVLSTIDDMRLRTPQGLVPLANFVSLRPVQQLAQISRNDEKRFIAINSGLQPGLTNEQGRPITPTERIELLTDWLQNEAGLPPDIDWEWTGDQEEQQESQTFLMYAFIGALGLMFAVLLAQFDSVYNAILVLLAVVLSTAGVMLGMLILEQPFSVIMTGTGIVALAGIVVNNNIVLIDTYQENCKFLPRIEAIIRTVEVRLRPVLLTSITTIAGLTPMMFGISIDLVDGGYTLGTPSSKWWQQLASAVVFGLATATALTLLFTPSLLAIRVWATKGGYRALEGIAVLYRGRSSRIALDRRLRKAVAGIDTGVIPWDQFQHILLPPRVRRGGIRHTATDTIDDMSSSPMSEKSARDDWDQKNPEVAGDRQQGE